MAAFIEVKILGGVSFIRVDQVVAVTYNDPMRCTVLLHGSSQGIGCAEPASVVLKRVKDALETPVPTAGGAHGDAG
ncbi:MAG: hypothetical protein KGI57_04070 [Hyphomicrobiales bacterium]|nr:hypothetical protein [Hyphomicrobiales bacterium]MDE2016863.1 hypothetical protein [Hyphomicrobiales bacterium]